MQKWLIRLLVVAVLAAGVVALRLTLFAPEPLVVEIVEPRRGRVESTVTNSKAGTIRARRRADLSPEIGGRVATLPIREGDLVRTGVLLLRLDDTSQRAQTEKANRDFVTAEARHREACLAAEQAEREYQRYSSLAERGIVATNLLEQAQSRAATTAAGCSAAAAAVESARAAIGVLESELRKTVLRAPFDGVISKLSIELGEYTTPSPPGLPIPPVMEIIDTTTIYVSAPMDEVDSARIRVGQPVRVTIDPFPGSTFTGTIARIAPYVLDIESQNRTVEVEVELDDHDFAATLLPGTSADVEVILEVRSDVLRLPTPALLQGGTVLVVGADEVLEERAVTTGIRNWDWTEILDGVREGDRVVTSLDRVEVQPGAAVVVAGEDREPAR